ncbi:hypothetical protein DRN63_03915 [Nanoarchaeota archaeon]|nr:MAG: hypothetical protein DRN63_03915 [Nanoarchaeota archaeon]
MKGYIERIREEFHVRLDGLSERIHEIYEKEDLWKELVRRCLACGVCTAVCPVCCCFNIYDTINIDMKTFRRIRRWDACTFPEFSLVAGGLNFRPEIKNRIKNWFYDKFKVFPDIIGKFGCVGCGRCITYCPAKIDIRKEISKIWDEKVD